MKKCTRCGREFGDDVTVCPDDGAILQSPGDLASTQPAAYAARSSTLAVTSLVLGILSIVLCLGPVLGIPALICGHIALGRFKKNPAQFGGGKMAMAGLLIGYLVTVIAILLLVLAAWVWPKRGKAKQQFDKTICVIRVAQLNLALRTWSANHNGLLPTNLVELTNELSSPDVLLCPDDPHHHASGSRAIQVWDPDNVSYQLLTPGGSLSHLQKQAVLRCPIHGLELMGDGSVSDSSDHPPGGKVEAKPKSSTNPAQ